MSKIQVNEIVNHFDNGAPDCPRGLTVTGVSTFSGNVSIGGTLTYEDVTNIDSVGIITAQSGLHVTGGSVGIGTATPSSHAQLDVVGSSYWPILVKTTSTGGGGIAIKNKDDITSLYTGSGGSSWLAGSVITDGLVRAQNNLLFVTNGNNERLRITSGGDINVAAGSSVFIANGNLKFSTAGTGIDFSADANAAGMTSELLDDYEEGTFTPTIQGATTAGSATYTNNQGQYVKVGHLVTVQLYIAWNSGTGSGTLRIHDLPFSVNVVSSYGGVAIGYWHNVPLSTGYYPQLFVANTSNFIYCYQAPLGGGASAAVPYSATGGGIIVSCTYRAA